MNDIRWRVLMVLLVLLLLPLAGECQRPPKRQLPVPPEVHELEFTGPEEGWPPRPQEQTNVTEIVEEEIPGSLTDALEAEIRQAALDDKHVQKLLGDRFAYISTDEVESVKGRDRGPSDPLATRVTFFSHTNNVAVEVRMRGVEVESVQRKEGYQPTEGPDEISEAIALALSDRRLQGKVEGLNGDAILMILPKGKPGYGHRVLYVAFSQEEEDHALYFAIVDLTHRTVLSAGPVAAAQRR